MSQAGEIDILGTHPEIPTQFDANVGFAVPIANVLEILGTTQAAGTTPVHTTGSGNTITTIVQLAQAIGSTNLTNVGLAAFDSADFSVDANGFVSLTGSVSIQFTEDSGTATPSAGNLNILGQKAGTIPVMFTIGSGSTVSIEDRTWLTPLVVDPSATVGLRGTFQTITAALAAATSGQTIIIRDGTYTENLTLVDNVTLMGLSPKVGAIINGSLTFDSGNFYIANINIRNSGGNGSLVHSSTNLGILYATNCWFSQASMASILLTGTSAIVNLLQCKNISGAPFISSSASNAVNFYNFVDISNGGAGSTSSGIVRFYNSRFKAPITMSGTQDFIAYNSVFDPGGTPTFTFGNTGTASEISNCQFIGTSTNLISISAGSTINITNTELQCSNASVIGGAGTLKYAGLAFTGTSSAITTTTQVPLVRSNDAVKITTPGAYPYTTISQDAVILVDSSSARTIIPHSSPTQGQLYRIKDNVGTAGTNNITITPSGANIDGSASYVISTNYGSIDIVFNGTQWNVL